MGPAVVEVTKPSVVSLSAVGAAVSITRLSSSSVDVAFDESLSASDPDSEAPFLCGAVGVGVLAASGLSVFETSRRVVFALVAVSVEATLELSAYVAAVAAG